MSLSASGVAVLWVTHDLTQMRRIADHVLVVIEGRIAHTSSLPGLDADTSPPAVRAFLAGESG